MQERREPSQQPEQFNPIDELGSIGEEQLPSDIQKTDKTEWDYTADRAKQPGPFAKWWHEMFERKHSF
jgi:hypothetical protein